MKSTIHVLLLCAAALGCGGFFYAAVLSFNHTLLQAAGMMGDKLAPPGEQRLVLDGGLSVGNRKGGSLDVGVTLGKDDQ